MPRQSRICIKCNINGTYSNICTKCKQKEKIQKTNRIRIKIPCKCCGKDAEISLTKKRYYEKNGGIFCKECRSDFFRKKVIVTNNSRTPEERVALSKKARSVPRNNKAIVTKQWETIRNNPDLWQNMQAQRAKQGAINWENRTDEAKNIQLQKWLQPKSRSKVSETFKQALIDNNLYDGFISEEPFHGFIPDEINHNLKIIIEVFGDLYHCNPLKYTNPDLYVKAIKRTVGEQWKRDRIRLACFYKHGYTVIVVWEKDIYNNINKQIERIKNEIDKKRNIN